MVGWVFSLLCLSIEVVRERIQGFLTPKERSSVRGSARNGGTPHTPGGSARSALSGLTGRSVVYSTRSMPGYMSRYAAEGHADAAEVDELWQLVQQSVAAPNSSRPALRGAVVPLSAVPAERGGRGAPLGLTPFHDRTWEVALRRRHERRVDNEPRLSETDKRAVASTRRRQWVYSSRRWVEQRKQREATRTKEERQESRRRLYSSGGLSGRKNNPRVYA